MAQKHFKCGQCGRKFSRAAHLARHRDMVHRNKLGPQKSPGAKKRKRASGRPQASVFMPGVVPTSLFVEMQAYHRKLLNQRAALEAQILAVTRVAQSLGLSSL